MEEEIAAIGTDYCLVDEGDMDLIYRRCDRIQCTGIFTCDTCPRWKSQGGRCPRWKSLYIICVTGASQTELREYWGTRNELVVEAEKVPYNQKHSFDLKAHVMSHGPWLIKVPKVHDCDVRTVFTIVIFSGWLELVYRYNWKCWAALTVLPSP